MRFSFPFFLPSTRAVSALIISILLTASPLLAESVRIKSFRPPAEVQRGNIPGKWFPVRTGIELNQGDIVKVGKGGRAILRMADGSRVVLWGGSRLEIKETAKKNSVFGLNFGRLKAIIKRLKGGRRFSVRTPLATASVRGTVFEMGFNQESRDGFLDVSKGAVALMQDGKEVLLPAGTRIGFAADRPLGEPVRRKAKASSQEGDSESTRAAVKKEVGLGMTKEEVMAAAAEEMRLAEYQEGKTLIDVNGSRVRLEEYIIRKPQEIAAADRDKAFKLVVLNERDNRFDYFYYRGVFNTTLPEDLSVALQDINGKLGSTQPTYYLTEYEMAQSNTQDSVLDQASGGHLVEISYDGTNYTLTDPSDATNTRTIVEDEQTTVDDVLYHKIYDPINDRFVTLTDTQFQAGDFRPAVYDPSDDSFRVLQSGDTYWRTRYNNYAHIINGTAKQTFTAKTSVTNTLALDLDADFTFAGGTRLTFAETPSGSDKLHNRVTVFYGDGTTETFDTYIISDEGDIGSTNAFNNVTTGSDFKTELLKWNYQQITTASEFNGRKIDLVVEPKILIKSGLIK